VEGIQLVFDGEGEINILIDWSEAMSSDVSEEQQVFTITIRTTSKKTKLDSYSHKSFYTPKVSVVEYWVVFVQVCLGMWRDGVCGVS